MQVLRGYKTELDPNKKQATNLAKHAGTSRYAWNWALNRCQQRISKPNGMALHKEWNVWKKKNLIWWGEISKCCAQEAFRDLQKAYKRFFDNCKNKKRGKKGHPKFRSKHGKDSFRVTGSIHVTDTYIQLPRIGRVKLKEVGYLPIDTKILSATVSRRADRWFVSLQVEEEITKQTQVKGRVGIDLGLKTFATCSDGEIFESPKALKSNLQKLKRLSRQHSKKEKGSKNRAKARKRLAKLYYRISNTRRDFIHKVTSCLTKTKQTLVIEDLNVSGMLKNRKLSRSVADVGFHEFRRQLEYKCAWYGCELVVADRWYPSSKLCSSCGWKNNDLTLSDRDFICPECGLDEDRDWNASKNLENYTVSSTGMNALGDESSGIDSGVGVKLSSMNKEPNSNQAKGRFA